MHYNEVCEQHEIKCVDWLIHRKLEHCGVLQQLPTVSATVIFFVN